MSSSSFARRASQALAVAVVLLFGAGAQAASAATRFVDDDHAQCPFAGFRSISAALAVARAGDTIRVCPGTYVEQVRIAKPGLQVVAAFGEPAGVFIRPPDRMSRPAAIVTLSAPATMLRGVTVLGRAPASLGPCAPDYAGVLVDSAAADLIGAPVLARDRVVNIVSRGCRSPFVPGAFANPPFPEETGDAVVLQSSAVVQATRIERPGEEGIAVTGTNAHALLSHVFARGRGEPTFTSNGVFSPQSATGEAANGVDILGPGAVVDIEDSEITDFTFQLSAQADAPNIEYGVKAQANTTLRLVRSIITEDLVGVGLLDTEGAFVADNSVRFNNTNILATAGTLGNSILRNLVAGVNSIFGIRSINCEDDSHGSGTGGTANIWQDNVGDGDSIPPGLCPIPPSSS
jgi:hypothetical protein